MIFLRRLAVFGLLLSAAMSSAWAALPGPVAANGGVFSIDGIQLSFSCNMTGSSGVTASGGCGSDQIQATAGDRGGISFQLQNVVTASDALADVATANHSSHVKMTLTITVTDNFSGKQVTNISATTVGTNNIDVGGCLNNCNGDSRASTISSAVVSRTLNPVSPLTTDLTINGGAGQIKSVPAQCTCHPTRALRPSRSRRRLIWMPTAIRTPA